MEICSRLELDIAPKPETIASLFNSIGQKILQQPISELNTTLSVQSLNAGIYILTIENKKEKLFFNQKTSVLKKLKYSI